MPESARRHQNGFFRLMLKVAAGIATIGLGLVVVGALIPNFVSHKGERPMIDSPGVIVDGACCVEPTYRLVMRILFAFGPLLILLGIVVAVAGLASIWFFRASKGGLARALGTSPGLSPESAWRVAIDAQAITVQPPKQDVERVALADIRGVAIETNDSGPWGSDVWWLLFGRDGKLATAFPQGATGEQAVVDYLTALPGFDFAAMKRAMGSTQDAAFVVWRMLTPE